MSDFTNNNKTNDTNNSKESKKSKKQKKQNIPMNKVAIERELKRAKFKNNAFIAFIVFAMIFANFYQDYSIKSKYDYLEGNILKIARTGSATTGNIWKIDSFVTQLAWASLFETDADFNEVNPYLCDSYTVSSDGFIYTITLKDNLKWSDGQPLTLDDVVFSIEAFLLNTAGNTTLSAAFNKIKGVDEWKEIGLESWENGGTHSLEGLSVNGNVLTIELDTPYTAFAVALTQFIPMPKHCFENTDIDISAITTGIDFLAEPICSGMYMVDCINSDGDLELIKNPYYCRDYSDIERVIMYGDYNNMHIDYYSTSNITEMVSYRAMPGFYEYDVDVEWYRYFVFNMVAGFEQHELVPLLDDNGNLVLDENDEMILVEDTEVIVYPEDREPNYPMHDIRVRQAISLAIDRETLLHDVYLDEGTISFANTGSAEYTEFISTFDPAKARELLLESDYDLTRPLTIGYYHTDTNTATFLAKVKTYLEDIGFTVIIRKTSGTFELYEQREYDFYLKAYPAYSVLDWYNEYLTTNDNLYAIIGTDEFDDLLMELDATIDENSYNTVMNKIQQLGSSTMYKLPLVSLKDTVYINSNRMHVPDDMQFGNVRYRSALRLDEWYIIKG